MEHVQKQHVSFNSRKGSSPSEVFLNISLLFFEFFLSRRCKNIENVHETVINTKIPF